MRVQHRFGGMNDESKSGGVIQDNRDFSDRTQDKIYAGVNRICSFVR